MQLPVAQLPDGRRLRLFPPLQGSRGHQLLPVNRQRGEKRIPPGRIQFASTNFAFNERDGVASIVLTRTGGNVGAASVRLRTVNGTATNPADYTATTVTVNWNGNDSANKTVDIPLVSDGLVEGEGVSVGE